MITLYQFPISHYCEKIRWALDYKGLEYKVINLMPGPHFKTIKSIAKKSEVPVIQSGDEFIQGSADIITWLDEKFPDKPLTPADEALKKQALEWESYVDNTVGPELRLYFYAYLLDRADLTVPLLTAGQSWFKRLVFRLMFPKVREVMKKFMKINEQTTENAKHEIISVVDRLAAHYENHAFLVDNQFSRADLAAASLLAPVCEPVQYGLPWPKTYPATLQNFIYELKPRLQWVDRLYQNFR